MDNKDALIFLQSVYQNEAVPLSVRMRAAQIAIEYERPRLAMTALIDGATFAARLERAIERVTKVKNGEPIVNGPKLIEGLRYPRKARSLEGVSNCGRCDGASEMNVEGRSS